MTSPKKKGVSTAFTTREINKNLKKVARSSKTIEIGRLKGHGHIAVGLSGPVRINVDGDAGDYFGSLNDGAKLVLNGKAGRFLADSMTDGSILVNGDVGHGAGVYMIGGKLVIKGDCMGDIGRGMGGGTLIIDGSVKGDVGTLMTGGTVVVAGHVFGVVGPKAVGGRLFVGGDAPRTAPGVEMKQVTPREYEELREMNQRYKFKSFQTAESVKGFKRALRTGSPEEGGA